MTDVQEFDDQEFVLDPDCELRFEVAAALPPGSIVLSNKAKQQKQNDLAAAGIQADQSSSSSSQQQQQQQMTIPISGLEVELMRGNAELFGTELAKNVLYTFAAESKLAIFTWHGCTLRLRGRCEVCYVARDTPMATYLSTHAALDQMRRRAADEWTLQEQKQQQQQQQQQQTTNADVNNDNNADGDEKPKPDARGPRVFVTGPADVGKASLCRILVNYAVRCGWSPVFVDLDPSDSLIAMPCTIGAVIADRQVGVEESFGEMAPLMYHLGHQAPAANSQLYNLLIANLAEAVNLRTRSSKTAASSGVIVRSSNWVRADGYQCLVHAAQSFEADVVLVLDQERLCSQLRRELAPSTRVVLLPKSGGVVSRSKEQRIAQRDLRIKQYFYGDRTPRQSSGGGGPASVITAQHLFPQVFDVRFADVRVFKIGFEAPVPDSCLPIGLRVEDRSTSLVPVAPSSTALLHRLLAVSQATEEDEVVASPLLGFCVATAVDDARKTMTVLAPSARPLPNHPNTILLLTEHAFIERGF